MSDSEDSYSDSGPMTTGVKGSDVYTDSGVGCPIIALSTKLVRSANAPELREQFREIILHGTDSQFRDAITLLFQTRDVRGGKGERAIFWTLFQELFTLKKDLAIQLLPLLSEYGSWDDVFTLAKRDVAMRPPIFAIAHKQLLLDEATVSDGESAPSISLLAKWAPREGKQMNELAVAFAHYLAKKEGGSAAAAVAVQQKHSIVMSHYRKRLARLNRYLDTVEIKECANTWAEIKPQRVPARAREIKKSAYLNEKKVKNQRTPVLRHPSSADRNACRANFVNFFMKAAKGEVKISGADTLYPHEIVKKAERLGHGPSEEDMNSLNAVWAAMVKRAGEGGGLGKSLFMCDFSGSMSGLPILVSKAMGLLGSAVSAEPFKGRFLTFDESPQWVTIPNTATTLFEQLKHVRGGQGFSTDFQKAGEAILVHLKKTRAPPGAAPENLIVVTDMGFDAACGSANYSAYTGASYRHVVKTAPQQTHAQMLREAFRRASEDVHGDPAAWPAPRIVIWNVAAHYSSNHQTTATEEGVLTLSGWSPSLFKILCQEGPKVITAYEALRAMLDVKRYDPVRQIVDEWMRGGWRGV